MQDGRNTSRSQEINVNSFNEGLCSSDRSGRPVVSEDKMSLNVEHTHDRTVRLVATLHAAQDDSQVCHEVDTLNVDDEVLRERMEKSIAVHDENLEPMMVNEADMDFRVPGQPHTVVKYAQSTSVRQLFRKLRTTQIDMLFNKIYNRINHLIPSVQNQNKWFRMWVTSNYVNYSRRNQKRSAKYVYHTGMNIGKTLLHVRAFLASRKRSQSRIHQLYDGPSFSPWVRHQERTTSRTSIW